MLKNLKIGKKLIISFIIVALIASCAAVVGMVLMQRADNDYSNALEHYGFAQGDVGKALATFCRVDGNVHDAISYSNKEHEAAAAENVKTLSAEIPGLLDTVEETLQKEKTKQLFSDAKAAWAEYEAKANELIVAAQGAEDTSAVEERIVTELDPIYSTVYDSLNGIMDDKVVSGTTVTNELTAQSQFSMWINIAIMAVAIIMSVIFGVVISNGISKPITACAKRLELLSHGILKEPVPEINTKDETKILADATKVIVEGLTRVIQDEEYLLGEMAKGNFDIHTKDEEVYIGDFVPLLDSMRNINIHLSDTLSQINQSAEQVSAGSSQVSDGAQALAQGATEQASSVEELSATIEEITAHIKSNAENAADAKGLMDSAAVQVADSNRQMQEMIAAMNDISAKSGEIGKIIKTIDDIAFQTNILALNAAVEAARAGEAGKGFAVVADEVRNLAGKSADAAKTTSALIAESISAVENGTKIADDTAKSMLAVVDSASKISNSIDQISNASSEQADAAEQVTLGVNQISAVVQTNSATAQESAAASEELNGQAQMMRDLVAKFKLQSSSNGAQNYAATTNPASIYGEEDGGFESEIQMPNEKY